MQVTATCAACRAAVVPVVMPVVMLFLLQFCGLVHGDEPADPRAGLLLTRPADQPQAGSVLLRSGITGSDGRIDPRIPAAGYYEWQGLLLVREPGVHRLHAEVSGRIEVAIDGRVMLDAEADGAFASGPEGVLSAGDHEIRIRLFQPAALDAPGFRLFWSSEAFTLEPIPPECLSHEPRSEAAAVAMEAAQRGRLLTDAMRCAACHAGWKEEPVLSAPDLSQSAAWLQPAEIAARLTGGEGNHGMPVFGMSAADAADVAAWLLAAAAPATESERLQLSAEDRVIGSRLVQELGCAACHATAAGLEREDVSAAYGGPPLYGRHLRRSAEWIEQWLRDPAKISQGHRMPMFRLSTEERRQLAATLAADEVEQAVLPQGDPQRGKKLVQQARCASCHKLSGMESPPQVPFRQIAGAGSGGAADCLAGAADPQSGRPAYGLSDDQQQAVRQWLTTVTRPLEPAGVTSEFLLQRKGCLSCHDRDTVRGLSASAGTIAGLHPDLRGRSEDLIPPALTAAGDRLRDEVLRDAVQGKLPVRLPWLLVRMPQFRMTEAESQRLTLLLADEDRIPDAADSVREELFAGIADWDAEPASAIELLEGNHLAGAGGFNCIACHSAGMYAPKNVAPGTRGSDLMLMGSRIRPRYFLRWMRNPIRILRGIEMPAIRKAASHEPPQTLQQQFVVLWRALSSSGFVPPTVVSRYEQTVAVRAGAEPRIIRDVFLSEGQKADQATARAIAIGFGNGLSVLFDLDQAQLLSVVAGEFARQRTEGKSWFWELAGVPVLKTATALQSRLRIDGSRDRYLNLVADESRTAELLDWKREAASVVFRQRLYFGSVSTAADRSPHDARTAWTGPNELQQVVLAIRFSERTLDTEPGLAAEITLEQCPPNATLEFPAWQMESAGGLLAGHEVRWQQSVSDGRLSLQRGSTTSMEISVAGVSGLRSSAVAVPELPAADHAVDSVPGFRGETLPLPGRIMPTGMTWLPDGRLGIASLRGRVWIASDTDGNGVPDTAQLYAEGFASPYGILADGADLLLATKPEVVRLSDTDGDGRADQFSVVASGWGYSGDYHDWTTGLVRDAAGSLYVGLGSDYSQKGRDPENDRWRGAVLRISSDGAIEPLAYSMRFPMGLAFNDRGDLFATDNQGVQNTFNELNHVLQGRHYGVPSRHETVLDVEAESATIQIPHPWTRSVNALTFLPQDFAVAQFAGHAIGCEYDTQCLIRMSFQEVDGILQGACYRFSRPAADGTSADLLGPISCNIGPDNSLYIGHIRDSGWQGAGNIGEISRLTPQGEFPNGICEIRAVADGFEVEFLHPLQAGQYGTADDWDIQSLTRVWKGSYATPDSDRQKVTPEAVSLLADGRTLHLRTPAHRAGYLYEFRVVQADVEEALLWPAEGFYTMKRVPQP